MPTRNPDPQDQDFDKSINTRPVTNDEVAYRDGYVRGKSAEQIEQDRLRATDARVYEENARVRADNGVSAGLVLGLVLAAVAAVIGGAIYVYTADQGTVTPTPEATTPQPANNDTTIIERTIERTRDVVPVPSNVQTPPPVNVEVNTPPAPAPAPAPARAPAPAPAPAPAAPTSEAAPTAPAQPETTTTPSGNP